MNTKRDLSTFLSMNRIELVDVVIRRNEWAKIYLKTWFATFWFFVCLRIIITWSITNCRGGAWEDEFLRVVGYAEDSGMFKHIRIARFASRTLDHELERNTRTVVPYFSSTFVLMGSFRWISCLFLMMLFATLRKRNRFAAWNFIFFCVVSIINL